MRVRFSIGQREPVFNYWQHSLLVRTPLATQSEYQDASRQTVSRDGTAGCRGVHPLHSDHGQYSAKVDASEACAYVEALVLGEGFVLESGESSVKVGCVYGVGSLTL